MRRWLVGLAVLGLAANAAAEDVRIGLKAEVTRVTDRFNGLGGAFAVGDKFIGSYRYDDATPDDDADPRFGTYRHSSAPYGIVLQSEANPDVVLQTDPSRVNFIVQILNNWSLPRDGYNVVSVHNLPLPTNGASVASISFFLLDVNGTVFSSDALPAGPPDLNAFEVKSMRVIGSSMGRIYDVVFIITELVLLGGGTPPAADAASEHANENSAVQGGIPASDNAAEHASDNAAFNR